MLSSISMVNKKGITLVELILVVILTGIISTLLTTVTLFVGTTVNRLLVKNSAIIKNLSISQSIIIKINEFEPQDMYIPPTGALDTSKSIYFSKLTYINTDGDDPLRKKTRTYNGLQSWDLDDDKADLLELKFDYQNETVTMINYNYDTGVESGGERRWSTFISICERNIIGDPYVVELGSLSMSDDINDTTFSEILNSTSPPPSTADFFNQDGGTKIIKIASVFKDTEGNDVFTYATIGFTVPSKEESNWFEQLFPS